MASVRIILHGDAMIDDGVLDLMILPEPDRTERLDAPSHVSCETVQRAFVPSALRHGARGLSTSQKTR